jgi:hypothetical protein
VVTEPLIRLRGVLAAFDDTVLGLSFFHGKLFVLAVVVVFLDKLASDIAESQIVHRAGTPEQHKLELMDISIIADCDQERQNN